MTTINLLPKKPQNVVREQKVSRILLVIAIIILIMASVGGAILSSSVLVNKRKIEEVNKTIDKLTVDIVRQNQIEQRQVLLMNRLEGVNSLLIKRVSFYERARGLISVLPEGITLTEMELIANQKEANIRLKANSFNIFSQLMQVWEGDKYVKIKLTDVRRERDGIYQLALTVTEK